MGDLDHLLTPRYTKYIPITPSPKQQVFLLLNNVRDILYGGAAGGGKSVALLTAALQFVDQPNYAAILFRRTYADLALPEALMDLGFQWLTDTDAKWIEKTKTWHFPSGSTLSFGYLDNENAKYRYQGSAFQFIGFDELTQFTESQYLYLFSRLRKDKTNPVPLRMRASANPGGRGHEWVKRRYILYKGDKSKRLFIPAGLSDNPYLDAESYVQSLQELDVTTREQLLNGDWSITEKGRLFSEEWFTYIDPENLPEYFEETVRAWDIAATEPQKGQSDPDYTVGVKIGRLSGKYYVLNVVRFRGTPNTVENKMREVAIADGITTTIVIEQDPGAAGKIVLEHYKKNVLAGFTVKDRRTTGDKETRAKPASGQAQAGNIIIVKAGWNWRFLEELVKFPYGVHDDQVDSFGTAMNALIIPTKIETFSNPFYT